MLANRLHRELAYTCGSEPQCSLPFVCKNHILIDTLQLARAVSEKRSYRSHKEGLIHLGTVPDPGATDFVSDGLGLCSYLDPKGRVVPLAQCPLWQDLGVYQDLGTWCYIPHWFCRYESRALSWSRDWIVSLPPELSRL